MSNVVIPPADSARAATPQLGMVRNSGWNLLGQAAPALIALAAMPVVVRELGPVRFGLLALAWTVVGYFTLFDLGFGRATVQRVSELVWSGEGARVGVTARTAVQAQVGIGLVTGALLAWGAGTVARVLVAGEGAETVEAASVVGLLALAVPAVLASNAYRALLEGLQRFDLVNLARAPLSAAMFLVPLLGVLVGWSLSAIIGVLVVTRYLGAIVFAALFHRVRPAGNAGFDRTELRRLLGFGGWVAASNVIIPLVVYLERLVVSGVHGAEALAYYSAPHELIARLLIIPAALASALFPAFSGLSVRGEAGMLPGLVGRGTKLLALIVAPISAALILTAAPLLTLWLGPDYGARGAPVLQILAAAAFLNALAYVPFALVEGRGKPEVVTKYHLFELPFYALVLWYGVRQFGIVGAALAWGCRMLWTAPVFYALALTRAGVSLAEPLRGGTGRSVAAGVALLLLSALVARLQTPGAVWVGLLLVAAFAATIWPWLLTVEDRAAVRAVFARARE